MSEVRSRQIGAILALVICTLLAGACGNNKGKIHERPVYKQTATTVLPLNHPLIETLGQLEGPYYFVAATSPCVVKLTGPGNKTALFYMLGLRNQEYPPDPDTDPEDAQSQAVHEAEIETRPRLFAFKQKAMAELFGEDPVWLLRMSANPQMPLAYIFKPERPPKDEGEAPVGPGQLLNALALRRGLATMELEGTVHSFYEMMLDAQLAAIVEARNQPEDNSNIWNVFHLRVPEDLESSVKKMEDLL